MSMPVLPFEDWKHCLRDDCERQDKLLAYTDMCEMCLQILWEAGTEPTVQGVIDGGQESRLA